MSSLSEHHKVLSHGVGKCSVPMWCMGGPAGFCDAPSYGERPRCREYYSYAQERIVREDGKYDGYVPGLACPMHGGPPAPQPVNSDCLQEKP